MEDDKIYVTDEDGNELVCDIVCRLERPETGKSYVVYTDHSADEDGSEVLFASVVADPAENDGDNLLPVETDDEWDFIEAQLADMDED